MRNYRSSHSSRMKLVKQENPARQNVEAGL